MPTFKDRRTGELREVPAEHVDWHNRDPEAFANWQEMADKQDEFVTAFSKVYKDHHADFSWDNPDHYLNKS